MSDRLGMIGPNGRVVRDIPCERVHRGGETVVCLTEGTDGERGQAHVLDAELNRLTTFETGVGNPSRVRIDPTGRYVGYTVLSGGFSYEDLTTGKVDTRTMIVDLETGEQSNVELLVPFDDGQPMSPGERTFWGLTFGADGRFYVTMAYAGMTSLMEGRIGESQLERVVDNAECPSVSPDGSTVAFKQRTGEQLRLALLDVASGTVTRTEVQLDDQVAWIDNDTLAFTIEDAERYTVMRLDLSEGVPVPWIDDAKSPAP